MCDLSGRSWWWVIIFRFSFTWVRTYIHTRTLLVLTSWVSIQYLCISGSVLSFFLFPSITPCCFFFLPSTRSAVVVRRSFLFLHTHTYTHTHSSPLGLLLLLLLLLLSRVNSSASSSISSSFFSSVAPSNLAFLLFLFSFRLFSLISHTPAPPSAGLLITTGN